MKNETQCDLSPGLLDALSRFLMWTWKRIMNNYFGRSYIDFAKKPNLVFTDSISYLGRFVNGSIPRIELSRHLLVNCSWAAVECVFYHEVAHQITELRHARKDILPHGKEFREVCRSIGAIPDASVELVALDEMLSREGRHPSGIEEKLRKLLTLANGGEKNEAEAALAKALELMAKYGLTEDDINDDNTYVTAQLGEPVSRMDITHHQILNILTDFWGVYGIFSYQPDFNNAERTLRTMTISGPRDKVVVAQYVYHYIINNMKLSYEKAKDRLFGRNCKRDFCSGFLKGISEKLRGVAGSGQVYALIHKGDAGTMEYVEAHFGPLRRTRSNGTQINENAIGKGFSEGSKLDIKPGVSEGGSKLLKE